MSLKKWQIFYIDIFHLYLLGVTIMGSTNMSLYGKTLGELVTLQFIVIFAFKLANPNANFERSLLFIVSIINDALQGLTLNIWIAYFTPAVATFQAGIKLRNLFLSEWVAFIFAVTCCYIILYLIETIFYETTFIYTLRIKFCTVLAYPVFWVLIHKIFYRSLRILKKKSG